MGLYYVSIQSWAVYVKEGAFFIDKGGLRSEWGRNWMPIEANSIEHARQLGKELGEASMGYRYN